MIPETKTLAPTKRSYFNKVIKLPKRIISKFLESRLTEFWSGFGQNGYFVRDSRPKKHISLRNAHIVSSRNCVHFCTKRKSGFIINDQKNPITNISIYCVLFLRLEQKTYPHREKLTPDSHSANQNSLKMSFLVSAMNFFFNGIVVVTYFNLKKDEMSISRYLLLPFHYHFKKCIVLLQKKSGCAHVI